MNAFRFVKPTLLSALLVLSPATQAAFAETVEITVLNTRGEDGIYRPALRIIRGGTVTFISAGQQGLTEAILRDVSQLRAWAGTNIPSADPDDPIDIQVTVIASSGGSPDCLDLYNARLAEGVIPRPDDPSICSQEEQIAYCKSKFPGGFFAPLAIQPYTPEQYCD